MALIPGQWSQWYSLASSNCKRIRWKQNNKRLRLKANPLGTAQVQFHQGRVYEYYKVRYRAFISLRSMARPGKFFYRKWRFGYSYREQ